MRESGALSPENPTSTAADESAVKPVSRPGESRRLQRLKPGALRRTPARATMRSEKLHQRTWKGKPWPSCLLASISPTEALDKASPVLPAARVPACSSLTFRYHAARAVRTPISRKRKHLQPQALACIPSVANGEQATCLESVCLQFFRASRALLNLLPRSLSCEKQNACIAPRHQTARPMPCLYFDGSLLPEWPPRARCQVFSARVTPFNASTSCTRLLSRLGTAAGKRTAVCCPESTCSS